MQYIKCKRTILSSLAIAACSLSKAQTKEVKFLLDTSIMIMKANSVNRDKVNWNDIQHRVDSAIVGKQGAYQLGPVYRMLFQSVNDFHGAIYCWDSTYRWQRHETKLSDSIMNEYKKGVFIQTRILPGNVGYLRVPYISFDERSKLDKKSQNLNDSLCSLLDKKVSGIVLDLRLNGGGAMYPMMLGLEQLLRNGKLGSFVDQDAQQWFIRNNGFYLDTMLLTAIVPKCRIPDHDIPVAILIGPATGSSGEFLAIAFKKRKNTIFVGAETAGYVTCTHGYEINDAVNLLIATGYGRDRQGQIYDQPLKPDISMNDPDCFNDIPRDRKVAAAAQWVKAHK